MILCVDVGNTFVKYGAATGEQWIALGRQATDRGASRWPAGVLKKRQILRKVDGVVVSSVVPSLDRPLGRRLRLLTTCRPLFVDHRMTFPFKLSVPRPQDIGVDRLCAASGACRHGARSAIIVDVGSAVTVDLVDRGAYVGGLILVGPSLALRALAEHTAKLPSIDFERSSRKERRLRGTARSMVEGARAGAVGAIREAVRRHRERSAGRPATFLTGGGAGAIAGDLPSSWRYEPDLVGRGLYRIWRLNGTSAS